MKATKPNFAERKLSEKEKKELEDLYPSWVEEIYWTLRRLQHGRRASTQAYQMGIEAAERYWVTRCADIVNPTEVDISTAFQGGGDCFERAFGLSDQDAVQFFSGFLFAIRKLCQDKETSINVSEKDDPSVGIFSVLYDNWKEIHRLKRQGKLRSVRDLAEYVKPHLAKTNPAFVGSLPSKLNKYGFVDRTNLDAKYVDRVRQICHRVELTFAMPGRPKKRRKL